MKGSQPSGRNEALASSEVGTDVPPPTLKSSEVQAEWVWGTLLNLRQCEGPMFLTRVPGSGGRRVECTRVQADTVEWQWEAPAHFNTARS